VNATISIRVIQVGQMQTNCYLMTDIASKTSIIVDPGDDSEYLTDLISHSESTLVGIIATHGHFDHIMGVLTTQLIFQVPFLLYKDDTFLVQNMRDSAQHFIGVDPGPPPIPTSYLKDHQKVKIGSTYVQVIHTPGHTPGSICLYSNENHFIITGDLLFWGGSVGRTDFTYSDRSRLEQSLKKILRLPAETIVYAGHGISTTIGECRDALRLFS
jgi:hydroxyacylglutathione hydrolase